jgi:hypothetical protein
MPALTSYTISTFHGPDEFRQKRNKMFPIGVRSASVVALFFLMATSQASAFDQSHRGWEILLDRNVVVATHGRSSRADYAAFKRDQAELNRYLDGLSEVSHGAYRSWPREQQLAFLINAYNAFTVKLVLSRFPGIKSIKDVGTLLQSPWKKEFFTLLGATRSLDELEHKMIREPGVFDEPRIHFALNCASVGCPMLREEAYTGAHLEAQLDSATRRFLGDRSRNRYDTGSRKLEISAIFEWYKADFERGAKSADG